MRSLEKLLSISSAPISHHADVDLGTAGDLGVIGEQLEDLLRTKNGFYAFESALHVFPGAVQEGEITLSRWNSFELWRFEYGELAEGLLFFAEDALGDQFCICGENVCSFTSETGELKTLADSLEGWAERILKEYKVLTGYPLLHLWQEKNGPLPIGTRLMPKLPFVLGGKYSLDNLYALSAVSGMRSRGNLAHQLKDVPDGSRVQFRLID